MKHKFFNAKCSAVIAAGMLLMALPMTAMAEKNTEATTSVETVAENSDTSEAKTSTSKEDSTTKEVTTETKEETKKEDTTLNSKEDTKTEETKAVAEKEAVFDTKVEEESKEEETTKASKEETADSEKETKADEKSTEDAVEETTKASEDAKEETKTEETEAETTVEETIAEVKEEAKLSEVIVGTWSADERTSLKFMDNGNGALILADKEYAFTYKIKDDQLSLNFSSSRANDGTYTASVSEDTLELIGGKGTIGGNFELSKSK